MEELNPTNAFGEDLLNAIEAQYESIDAGIEALMETTGLGEEEVIAIIQGDVIVEDEQLLSAIIDAFPDADDDDIALLIESATEVDEGDREALVSEIEANEGGMEEMPEGADYSAYYRQAQFQQANYLSQLEQENAALQQALYNQNARLTNVEANFSAQQAADVLDNIDAYASDLVDNGYMPPSIKHMILGSFNRPAERLANFSQLADHNGVDIQTQLYATQFALELMQQATAQGVVDFQDYSLDAASLQQAEFSASLDEVAAQDAIAILGDKMTEVR